MFLQAVPPPIPPPPPPGLFVESDLVLMVIGLLFGMWIFYKDYLKTKYHEHTQQNRNNS